MRRLARIYRWIFRHHRCTSCGLPRPVWMPGPHTLCLMYELENMRREEVHRHVEEGTCEECGELRTHKGTCSRSAMRNSDHPFHQRKAL